MVMYMQGELMILVLQFNSFLIYEILQVSRCVYLIKHVVSSVISCVFVYLSLIIQVPPICRFSISDFFMPPEVHFLGLVRCSYLPESELNELVVS